MPMPTEPPVRFWTRASIENLAETFDLPNDNSMQDWAYEVANPVRTEEFIEALSLYENDPDTQFTLMDIILQSLEESQIELEGKAIWFSTSKQLTENFELHAHQIWYWSAFNADLKDAWRISPLIRKIWYEYNPTDLPLDEAK